MLFEEILPGLRKGLRAQRSGWNGKGMWISIQSPTDQSKMTLSYLYMKTADDHLVPWLASQADILANDWGLLG